MKLGRVLLLSVATICNLGASKPPVATAKLDYFQSYPLYLNDNETEMRGTVVVPARLHLSISIYIVNDYYPEGILIYSEKFTSDSDFVINYDNAYTLPSNNLLRIIENTGLATKTHETELDVAIGSTYNIINDEIMTSNSSYVVYTKENGFEHFKEIIGFNNFVSPYVTDYYHKLDIGSFNFITYQGLYPSIPIKKATLIITNRNNEFDDFDHNENLAEFSLDTCNFNEVNFLSFSDNLFVEKTSLHMLRHYKEGYVATRFLYFPRNEKRFESEYDCSLILTGFGIDYNKIVFHFKLKSLLNILGDCRNSEYCIVNK